MRYARGMLGIEAPDAAARECYFAVFHAAMALLYERHDLRPKTHKGVHVRFAAEVMADEALPRSMSEFLVYAYRFKQVADYETDRPIGHEQALAALTQAEDFVTRIEQALATPAGE